MAPFHVNGSRTVSYRAPPSPRWNAANSYPRITVPLVHRPLIEDRQYFGDMQPSGTTLQHHFGVLNSSSPMEDPRGNSYAQTTDPYSLYAPNVNFSQSSHPEGRRYLPTRPLFINQETLIHDHHSYAVRNLQTQPQRAQGISQYQRQRIPLRQALDSDAAPVSAIRAPRIRNIPILTASKEADAPFSPSITPSFPASMSRPANVQMKQACTEATIASAQNLESEGTRQDSLEHSTPSAIHVSSVEGSPPPHSQNHSHPPGPPGDANVDTDESSQDEQMWIHWKLPEYILDDERKEFAQLFPATTSAEEVIKEIASIHRGAWADYRTNEPLDDTKVEVAIASQLTLVQPKPNVASRAVKAQYEETKQPLNSTFGTVPLQDRTNLVIAERVGERQVQEKRTSAESASHNSEFRKKYLF